MNSRRSVLGIALSTVMAALLAGVVYAQGARGGGSASASAPDVDSRASSQRHMASMMGERKMMPDMQAAEKRLDELLAKMNASQGADKIDDMAAVVNELVAQHTSMHRMMSMPGSMMERMKTAPQSNDAAPASPANPEADHKEHHP